MWKNVAGQHAFAEVVTSAGAPVTSGVTVYVAKDAGAQAAGGGTAAHVGNGCWRYDPTQAETNADCVAFTFVPGTGVPTTVREYTSVQLAKGVQHGGPNTNLVLGVTAGSALLISTGDAFAAAAAIVNSASGTAGSGCAALKLQATNNANGVGLYVTAAGVNLDPIVVNPPAVAAQVQATIVPGSIDDSSFNSSSPLHSVHSGLTQAGSTSTTAVLSASASAVDGEYVGRMIRMIATPGPVIQTRMVVKYVGATRAATIDAPWDLTPGAAQQYYVFDYGAGHAILSNGAAHGGAAASLALSGVTVAQTASNQPAVSLTGNGTGAGLQAQGGTSGNGVYALAGLTGAGFYAAGGTGSGGIEAHGGSAGPGLNAVGGSGADGIKASGGSVGGGKGINAIGTGSGFNAGIQCTGTTGQPGLWATGGTNGAGAIVQNGGASGSGLVLQGAGSGNDLALNTGTVSLPPESAGRPATLLGMVRRLFEWACNKKTRNRATGAKSVYGADGVTVLETQTQSSTTTGGVTVDQETQGA